MNEAIATNDNVQTTEVVEKNDALVLDTAEKKLGKEVSVVEQNANNTVVASDEDYATAAELTAEIKRMQKKVVEYWEPMRKSTYDAYQKVNAHKKEMLDPLEAAEKTLKKKMGEYTLAKERERKAKEEEMRRLAQQEVDKKLNEAAEAEQNGDVGAMEMAMAEAEVMDNVMVTGGMQSQTPKAKGVSQSKTWKITKIDSSVVPVNFSGMELRPVDEKLVLQLIKASKGKIQIPGVTYEEDVVISVRT